jgi:hypothetical protein
MSVGKQIDDVTETLIGFVVLVVIILIVYGVIKIFNIGGNTGENINKTAEGASGAVANAATAANKISGSLLNTGDVPAGTPGAWNKLIASGNSNPLVPSTWTGPQSDSTSADAIAGFISDINNLPGNHWYDVFKLGEDLNDLLGGAPAQIVGVFQQMPSQTDIYQAVSGYNSQYSDDIYSGAISSLDSGTLDSLATIILAKPLTV